VRKEVEKREEKLTRWAKETVLKPVERAVLRPAGQAIAGEAEHIWRRTVLPFKLASEAGQAAVGNKSWGEALEEMERSGQAIASTRGRSLGSAGQALGGALNTTADIRRSAGSALAGDIGEQVVEGGNLPLRLLAATGITATQYSQMLLEGKDPKMLLAAPLAAALRAAHAQHAPDAKPLPLEVQEKLRDYFAPGIVERARYTVGQVEISLPNALNRLNQMFGSEHAVVVDDLIIFSREPMLDALDSDPDELFWVAHEVHHVEQYETWGGIGGFAYVYTNYPGVNGKVERQADSRAEAVVRGWFGRSDQGYARLFSASRAYAGHPGYLCRNGELTRRVFLEHWEAPGSAPCTVGYQKEGTAYEDKQVLWYAWNEVKHCTQGVENLVAKLERMNWSCTPEAAIPSR
jgi:hypothetical protein